LQDQECLLVRQNSVMPSRCYPPAPEFGPGRTAERRVWEVLRDQLPDGAALLHSVAMIERATEHEADLVIAWPGVGIAVIEVKGGHISRDHGQWYQSSSGSTRAIKDPVVQAQDCKHVLHRLLVQHGSQAAAARSAHLVAFPFTGIAPGWSYAGCTRDMILARSDLATAADRIRTAIDRHGSGHAPLTGAGLDSLLEVLEGQLPGQLSLLSWAEENEAYVDQLTRDQAKVVRILREQRRLKVIGGAGTGKTWLALEQARHLAAGGERVALVCYSRGLARFLQRMTAEWPSEHRPAYVGLFHALPLAWGADPPPPDEDLVASTSYYEERLPAQMGELAARLEVEEKYDAIVIDEAQDFGAAWWPPTMACLRDQETGGLYAFMDEAQRVFERHGEVPIPLPPIVLEENIRNTKQIAQVFGSLDAGLARYRGMDGPPVRFVQCPPEEAVHEADAQVDRLLGEGWEPGQIALLVTGRRHQLQKEILGYHGWEGYWDAFFAGDDVFYGHVLGFKGLERPVVVLAVNGMHDQSRGREYLYVGLSRARSFLVVCGDLDHIAALGGPGLRRRLGGRRQQNSHA
jgi:phosphoglycolate phosphatase-like HAD superfamily hydrolase